MLDSRCEDTQEAQTLSSEESAAPDGGLETGYSGQSGNGKRSDYEFPKTVVALHAIYLAYCPSFS